MSQYIKSKQIPIIIDGIRYESVRQASQRLGVGQDTLTRKVREFYAGGLKERDMCLVVKKTFTFRKVNNE